MYCKYCGYKIPDDSIFCTNCGKKVSLVNSSSETILENGQKENEISLGYSHTQKQSYYSPDDTIWMNAKQFRWRKPYFARVIQIGLLLLCLLSLAYGIFCVIHGGEVYRYFIERETYPIERSKEFIRIYDPLDILEIYSIEYQKWNEGESSCSWIPWAFSYDDIELFKGEFIISIIFLFILPILVATILIVRWTKYTRFPNEKSAIIMDYADRIQKYEWFGFNKKYVFIIKNGKWGVADVTKYRIIIPPYYDSIYWIVPNVSCRMFSNGIKRNLNIEFFSALADVDNEDRCAETIVKMRDAEYQKQKNIFAWIIAIMLVPTIFTGIGISEYIDFGFCDIWTKVGAISCPIIILFCTISLVTLRKRLLRKYPDPIVNVE